MVTFTRHGDLSLHSAAFELNGRAVIVAAPGRHGKTTLALALHGAGCRLLTEDIARVQFQSEPAVMPGPTLVRMRSRSRPEVPDGMRLIGRDLDRAYIELTPDRRGDGSPVPLAAIVLLHIDERGELRLERVDGAAAVRDLWALSFRVPDTEDRARAFHQLADLATAVPIYNFHRPLTFESLPEVVSRVMELCAT
jgi:hypothetical protein